MSDSNGYDNPNYGNGKVSDSSALPIKDDGPLDDEEKKEEKEEMKMVGMLELFRYAKCFEKTLMTFGTLFALIHGAGMPMMIVIFGEVIDTFVINATDLANQSDTEPIDLLSEVGKYSIYFIITGGVVLVAGTFQLSFWLMSANSQGQTIRVALFKNILRQNIGWFDTHEVGELNTRLSGDVTKIVEGTGDKVSMVLQALSSFVVGLGISFYYGWKLSLVIIAVSPLLALCGGFMGKIGAAYTAKELKAYAKAGSVAEESISSIRTVAAFGGEKKVSKKYDDNLHEAKTLGTHKGLMIGAGLAAMMFVLFCTYALAFWYGSKLVREDDSYTAGTMLIVFFNILIGAFAIGGAAPHLQALGNARGAAYSLWEILDTEPPIDSTSPKGKVISNVTGNIRFKGVHFTYPARKDTKILDGVTVEINAGQTVALVGHSGCGKSTMVQLIQRFYDPDEGSVMLDGMDIKTINLRSLREHIGVVSQEPVLFDTTIAENIKFGRENVTQNEIDVACKHAKAYEFINKLPKKFDTLVGERGAQLSGGQKQRIAIARALVRDPKILLLDEATSALDTESEASVQAALDQARLGRTTIVVAHRLSTIRTADAICGLSDGRVMESGTHEQLMQIEDGVYKNLVERQTVAAENDENITREVSLSDIVTHKSPKRQMSRQESVHGKLLRTFSVQSENMEVTKDEDYKEVPLMRIWKINSPELFMILLGCISSLSNGAVQPAFAIIFAEILNVYSLPIEEQADEANFYSLMFVVIGIGSGFFMFLQSLTFTVSGERLTQRLRSRSFYAMLRQDMSFFDDKDHSTGALTTRLATETTLVSGCTGPRLGSILQILSSLGTGVVIGFIYSWQLTLLVLAFAPFMVISGAIQMKVVTGQVQTNDKALETAGKLAVESFTNIRTVCALGKEDWFIKNYASLSRIPYKKSIRSSQLAGIAFGFSQALVLFAYAASYYVGALLVEDGKLDFVNMMKVLSAIIFGALSVGQASAFAPDFSKARLAANKVFYMLDKETKIDPFSTSGLQPSIVKGNLDFSGVEFQYPSRPTVPVLQGLDLKVNQGEKVALVGTSGCGKSTTIQLIERFYDPVDGTVSMDSNNLCDLNVGWLRSQLGLVSQEPTLFDASIAENIAYGDNSRVVPQDEIIQAARDANIHQFIESLPTGYDTNVGDKGTQLSGGQKQRIAIARALVRNPKILLLDEATSALDTESEQVVQEALERAQEGRTCIVIAHRLSTIVNSDKIFVINNGKIVETGTHSELLALKGAYYNLNQTQLSANSNEQISTEI